MQLAVYFVVTGHDVKSLKRRKAETVVGRVVQRWVDRPTGIVHHFVVEFVARNRLVVQKKFSYHSMMAEEKSFEMWVPIDEPRDAKLQLVVNRFHTKVWASELFTAAYTIMFLLLPFFCIQYDVQLVNPHLDLFQIFLRYIAAVLVYPVSRQVHKNWQKDPYPDTVVMENEDPANAGMNRPVDAADSQTTTIDQRLLLRALPSNREIILRNIGFLGCSWWFITGQTTSGLPYYFVLFAVALLSACSIVGWVLDVGWNGMLRRVYREEGIQVDNVRVIRTMKLSNARSGPHHIIEYKYKPRHRHSSRVLTIQKRVTVSSSVTDLDETKWRMLPSEPWSVWYMDDDHDNDLKDGDCGRVFGIVLSPCIVYSFASFDINYGIEFWFQVSMTIPMIALVGVISLMTGMALSNRQAMLGRGLESAFVVHDEPSLV